MTVETPQEAGAPAPQTGGPPAIAAWAVHAFTFSGAILGFLAVIAIERGDFRLALLWLLIALAVDGVDGTLARWAHVKTKAARIDGDAADLIIDYLTYVFVPTILIWKAGLVPDAWIVPLAALIQLSSLYLFTRRDMKTDDNYFRGFPSLWNVVALYLLVGQPGPEVGAAVVVFFALCTFAPVHFVHPFRVTDYGRWAPLLALFWAAVTVALLWPGWDEGVARGLLWASLATGAVLLAIGFLRTLRGAR
jgi:phosphatidylcholine synthase